MLDLWFENPFEVTQEQAESIGTKLMLLNADDIVFNLKLNTHSCNFCEMSTKMSECLSDGKYCVSNVEISDNQE